MKYSRFETELIVRPDDIDMNNHVHNSKYLDYVLAARYDQMKRCYKMSMDEFLAMGMNWVVKVCSIQFKRPLVLGDAMIVRTWIHAINGSEVTVHFEIYKKEPPKISAGGQFVYTMINIKTGRAEHVPQHIIDKYSI